MANERSYLSFKRLAPVFCIIVVIGCVQYITKNGWSDKEQEKEKSYLETMQENLKFIQESVLELDASKSQQLPIPVKEAKDAPFTKDSSLKTFPWQGIAYRRQNGSWTSDDSMCKGNEPFDEVVLKTPTGNTPIFIHDIKNDRSVSGYLKDKGQWEPEITVEAFKVLTENPDHIFVDVGGNVGTVSLAVALLGNRVISIEPYPPNAKRLCRGVIKGGFAGRMVTVTNAVSNVRETVNFKIVSKQMAMVKVVKDKDRNAGADVMTTSSIILDDLLEMFTIKSCVLKLDCEDMEVQVLKGAEKFFDTVDVRMVLIEWDKLRYNPGAPFVMDMMKKRKFIPFKLGQYNQPLNVDKYRHWKERNVVFKRM